jgi:hypothetical protein
VSAAKPPAKPPVKLPAKPDDPRSRRRSRRLRVRIRILVRVETERKEIVWEETDALIVNAHGALILLAIDVRKDKFLTVQNADTGKEILARITSLGPRFMGKAEVGIEFIRPAPEFWALPEPPEDWQAGALPKARRLQPQKV